MHACMHARMYASVSALGDGRFARAGLEGGTNSVKLAVAHNQNWLSLTHQVFDDYCLKDGRRARLVEGEAVIEIAACQRAFQSLGVQV